MAEWIGIRWRFESESSGGLLRNTHDTQHIRKKIRYRDHDVIINDIKQQIDFSKSNYIYFTDDNFAVNPKFTKILLKRIIHEKIRIRFSAQVRCEITMDQELMQLMKAAGAYLVFVGFESINDESLRLYKKGGKQSKRQIEESISEFHKHGMNIHGMFVIGADTDQPGTAIKTARWALTHNLNSIQMLPICPLPGTEVIRQFDEENRILRSGTDESNEPYIKYGVGNTVLYKPKLMSAIELQEELITAYKIFYNRRNILKALSTIHKHGIESVIYRITGRSLVKRVEPEIREHLRWLKTIESMDPGGIADNSVLKCSYGKMH